MTYDKKYPVKDVGAYLMSVNSPIKKTGFVIGVDYAVYNNLDVKQPLLEHRLKDGDRLLFSIDASFKDVGVIRSLVILRDDSGQKYLQAIPYQFMKTNEYRSYETIKLDGNTLDDDIQSAIDFTGDMYIQYTFEYWAASMDKFMRNLQDKIEKQKVFDSPVKLTNGD